MKIRSAVLLVALASLALGVVSIEVKAEAGGFPPLDDLSNDLGPPPAGSAVDDPDSVPDASGGGSFPALPVVRMHHSSGFFGQNEPPLLGGLFGNSGKSSGHHTFNPLVTAFENDHKMSDKRNAMLAALKAERERRKRHAEHPSEFTVPDDGSCEFQLDGESFDFSDLRLHRGQAEYLTMDSSRYKYEINVCGAVTSKGSECQRSNGMICQYTPGPGNNLDGVISRWSAEPHAKWSYINEDQRDAGVKLTTKNGDDCTVHGQKKPREAVIFFPCNEDVKVGSISVQETATCTYVFNIPTKYSCPGHSGMSAGWMFVAFLFFGSIIYIVLGVLYNRFRHNATGIEAFPNIEFWKDLPSLVRDGIMFTWGKVAQKATSSDTIKNDEYESI